ncbi:putative capsid protein [Lake Sinai virus 3]|nr:putative capsid protein [Lake Sinai virus 3]
MNQQQPNPSQRQPRFRYQPGPSRSARRRRNRRRRVNAIHSSGTVALQPSRITRRVVTNLTKRSPTISSRGLAWLRQYLNPMGPLRPALRFPDGSAVTTCIADYSNNFNISSPREPSTVLALTPREATLLDAATYAKIDAWTKADITLCILALPMLRNVVMVRLYPTTPTAFTLSDGIPNFVQRFPNWSAFTTEGKVLNNGDSPGYIQSFIYLPNVDKHLSAARGYRLLSRGLTGIYTAPSLETQGFVTACQYLAQGAIQTQTVGNNFVQSVEVNADKTVKNVEGKRLHYSGPPKYVFPLEGDNCAPSSLVETYHQAYQSRAVDGFYMPLLSSSRDNPFASPKPQPIAVYNRWYYRGCLDPIPASKYADGPSQYFYDLNLADDVAPLYNTGVVWMEGISSKFSLKLKTRTVIQYIPTSGSVLANFTRHEPTYDQVALDAADRIRNMMPHAYPATYNDWGWLGDLLDSTLSMLPGIGTAYRFAKPLIKPAWNWLGGKVSDFFGNPVSRDGDIFYDAK